MAFALSLYSRPHIVPVCIRALMERLEGRITQAELEEKMEKLQDKQIDFLSTDDTDEHRLKL